MGIFEDLVAEHWSTKCNHEYEQVKKLKEAFGDRFDDLNFMNYETGDFMKGAALRDAQTGCEIQELRGWHKSGFNLDPSFRCGCKQFDEQLCFVSEEGQLLSNTDYRITLADGRAVSGTTDNDGNTKRIKNTQKEQPIEKVEFFCTIPPFCPQKTGHKGKLARTETLNGITTTQENVGSSVGKVTLENTARNLTAGEIAMAKTVFKDAITYSKVKVHKNEYLPFGIQNDKVAMTPNGEMYFNKSMFKEDFSEAKDHETKIWFIHEMAHVWQYHLGYWVFMNGAWMAISGGYYEQKSYNYDLKADNGKSLPDFNFEQQGDIIAHYFAAKFLNYTYYLPELAFLESVLKEFIRNPKNAKLLPK